MISDTVASGKVNSTDGVKYVFSFPLNLPASNRGRQIVEREYGRKVASFSLFPFIFHFKRPQYTHQFRESWEIKFGEFQSLLPLWRKKKVQGSQSRNGVFLQHRTTFLKTDEPGAGLCPLGKTDLLQVVYVATRPPLGDVSEFSEDLVSGLSPSSSPPTANLFSKKLLPFLSV